jgi:3-hydroxyisobutyrate dehydrogenase
MLSDDQASREAWLGESGALRGVKAGAIAMECSTVTPRWIAELTAHTESASVALLDAPVTGSRMQAASGQLNFLIGGDAAVLEKVRPVLEAMGQSVTYVGPTGSAARLKLINNFLCGVQLVSIAEAMSWIERSGLDREAAFGFLKGGAPGSPMMGAMSARMIQATYEVNFLLSLMKKDMEYAAADAEEFGLELRTIEPVGSRLKDAVAAGWSEKDMSAVVEIVRTEMPPRK